MYIYICVSAIHIKIHIHLDILLFECMSCVYIRRFTNMSEHIYIEREREKEREKKKGRTYAYIYIYNE